MKPTVIILTFNSEASLAQVVASCRDLAWRVLVVDSYSTDRTVELARSLGCEVVQHPFENYSAQRNWAQQHAGLGDEDWVLHLDSDEVLSERLAEGIRTLVPAAEIDGYLMRRLSYFLGRPIRFGHINPSWHLRLYRAERGYCEERLYDQHFVVPGRTQKLHGLLLDLQITTLEKWTAAHNRWSTAEAQQVSRRCETQDRMLPASLLGDPRMRKRWLKNHIWYRVPLLVRPFVFFFYSYFLRLGFLDGQAGLIYHVLQAFWFRYLVDAKIIEMRLARASNGKCPS
jgi:glycosyltransferase involved in cell wall biosynthesis